MSTKPFSQTKYKGNLFLVAKSSGPLLARTVTKVCVESRTSHVLRLVQISKQ